MTRLLASLTVAFAMFFSPLAMEKGGAMAMARATVGATDGGCAGMQHPASEEQKSDLKMNCAAACAALPGAPATTRADHSAQLPDGDRAFAGSFRIPW